MTTPHTLTRPVVLWAACSCTDREHDDHGRLDWTTDQGDAFDAGFDKFPANTAWHLIRCEEVSL